MATSTPNSFFPEQGSTQEGTEQTEPEPVYLSEDSEPEKKDNEAFTSGAPGFASLSSFVESVYIQNPNFQSRNSEIATMKTVVDPEEDKKLPPSPSSSSKHESDSEFEPETEVEKKKKPKTVKLVSKSLRVKRNLEHGLRTEPKKPKKGDLWSYTEQTLSPGLILQVLPMPTDSFVFRGVMTMKKVEKEVTQHIDNELLVFLKKFGVPTCGTIKLSDVQTEKFGFLLLRRVIVRKRLSAGKYTYAVMPNLVMSSKKKVYHNAQGVWYEKTTTNNRSKEMTIPKPFQGNQSIDVLFDNTFSWDV